MLLLAIVKPFDKKNKNLMDFLKPHNSHKIELVNWEIPAFIQL